MAMVRDALALAPPAFVAVRVNVTLVAPVGAMKFGDSVSLAFNVTTGPAVCAHLNVAPGDTVPTMVTALPAVTLAGALIVTLGGGEVAPTFRDTVALVVSGTVFFTATLKVRTAGPVTLGALKVGVGVLAPTSATPGPPVCVQRKLKGRAGTFGSLLLNALNVTS
jgi:hypothetical protein